MDNSLKRKYPYRLATTSFIYRADYVTNVQKLAPFFDEIELLIFESQHLPDENEIEELCSLAKKHEITYNVHLPMDIDLAADDPVLRQNAIAAIDKALNRVSPLHATTHTLHLEYNLNDQNQEAVKRWQHHAKESLYKLLDMNTIAAGVISIETLDFSPLWLKPIVEELDLAICVDMGHILLYGYDLEQVLDMYSPRTTMIHLHGVENGNDHLSLKHLSREDQEIISRYLNHYNGSLSIEVFHLDRLSESMSFFPKLMELYQKES